ncbi:hypothetical protein R6Q59_002356 [Mikania micrantha]|uniref:Membrane-associated kinase regulator 6 n=1 Tax=Mikania micrantha TaxID=192012 RepID=A0A5N6NQ14_9ASTR|nr:hypothetical protein E3N88_19399 [Mikania micrantha]
METSQPLTIESFSYSWLINDCNQEEYNTNSIANSPKEFDTRNFSFDLRHAMNLVDADEIFHNGHIVPKSVNQMKLYSCPATPVVHFQHKKASKCRKKYSQLIADWRVSSKRVFRKCFSFFLHRKGRRVVDSSRNSVYMSSSKCRNEEMNMRIEVYETTFRRTKSWNQTCSNDKSYDDYNEGSVHDAIAHCKRSLIGT